MSRKSRRNRPPPQASSPTSQPAPSSSAPPQPAPAKHPEAGPGRTVALAIVAITLVLAAVLSVKFVVGDPKGETQSAAPKSEALRSAESPTLGPADARVHIVEFLDPACETCATFYPLVKKIMADHPGKIRLSIRHVPFHKGADEAVRILEAARAQGRYFETLEVLLATQDRWTEHHRVLPERIAAAIAPAGLDMERLRKDMQAPEIAARMARDMDDARALAVTRTPEYFVNGRALTDFGLEELRALVYNELRRAYP